MQIMTRVPERLATVSSDIVNCGPKTDTGPQRFAFFGGQGTRATPKAVVVMDSSDILNCGPRLTQGQNRSFFHSSKYGILRAVPVD